MIVKLDDLFDFVEVCETFGKDMINGNIAPSVATSFTYKSLASIEIRRDEGLNTKAPVKLK